MTISSLIYKSVELHAYATQEFPTVHDPFAPGARRFSSIVGVDALAPNHAGCHRYQASANGTCEPTMEQALETAIQVGKALVDGTATAPCLSA